MDVTKRIAEYVATTSLEDFPEEAVQAAKGAIIDCLGCMLGGSVEPLANVLCNYLKATGASPSASVVVLLCYMRFKDRLSFGWRLQ